MYTHSQTLKPGSLPHPKALFWAFSSVVECKAAIKGLAVDSTRSTYCLRSHNEAYVAYQIGMLDAQTS